MNSSGCLPMIRTCDKIFKVSHGGCSSMAECLTVDQDVAGSTPVSHPDKRA